MYDVLYFLACLFLPIAWGVVVNWLFNRWQNCAQNRMQDYQI